MKKILLIATLPLLTISLSCKCQKNGQSTSVTPEKTASSVVNSTFPQEKPQNNIVRLKEKENIFLKNEQLNATFKKVKQDSRCPMNARCIWAGNATAVIELMSTTSRPSTFELSIGDLKNNLTNSVNFSGYKISLENLYPSNSTEETFEKLKGKYIIDLKVEKATK